MIQIDGHYLDGALTDSEISTLAASCGIIHTWPGRREEYIYISPIYFMAANVNFSGEHDRHFLQTAIIFSDLHPLITAQNVPREPPILEEMEVRKKKNNNPMQNMPGVRGRQDGVQSERCDREAIKILSVVLKTSDRKVISEWQQFHISRSKNK